MFGIESFSPAASAVRIGPDLLVTNRHNVVDEPTIKIRLKGDTEIEGKVIPTGYNGDLILVRAALPDGPVAKIATTLKSGRYFTVGYDLNRKRIWAYDPGALIALPAKDKPFARLHHTAYTQPGNSGGALVNAAGELVGIVTSGGAGRFEAIPISALKALQADSGDAFAQNSATLGSAYRACRLALEERGRDALAKVTNACPKTNNRQFLDLTAQALGRARKFKESIALSRKSVARDPNAVNALIALATTLQFSGDANRAVPHVEHLMQLTPKDDRIHALAASVGVASSNEELVDKAMALVKQHKPERLPFITRLIEAQRSRAR